MNEEWINAVHVGDCLDVLPTFPESSVHMVMCSPPYYGLRDYGVDEQIGLEDDLSEYIESLVDVGRAIRRVLRPDGSWWLNLGDSYATNRNNTGAGDAVGGVPDSHNASRGVGSLGRKQKMLVPHRVAIALQEDGWVVRNDVTWVKPNPMPSSVKDRLNTTTEMLFHLTPNPDYWYDLDAIREPHKSASIHRSRREDNRHEHSARQSVANEETLNPDQFSHPNGKNPGDVFEIPTLSFPESHFAVYPPALCTKPIKATAPPLVCADCGQPYERETEELRLWERDPETIEREQARRAVELANEHGLTEQHFAAARAVGIGDSDSGEGYPYDRVDAETAHLAQEVGDALGSYYREFSCSGTETADSEWVSACDCETEETKAGIVLDPFVGAGTTLLEAKRLQRRFVGVDLNPAYADLSRVRVGLAAEDPSTQRSDDQRGLESYGGD